MGIVARDVFALIMKQRFLFWLEVWLLLLVCTLRFGSVFFVAAKGIDVSPIQDPLEYATIAKNVLAGHGYSIAQFSPYFPDLLRPPAYPLFLAGTYLLHQSGLVAVLLQQGMSIVVGVLLYLIFYQHGRRRMGLLVAALLLLEPQQWFLSLQTMSETLFTLTTFVALYLLFWYRGAYRDAVAPAIAGGIFALAMLTRPIGMLWLPWVLLALCVQRHFFFRRALLFLIVFVSVLSPWMWRNMQLVGKPEVSVSGPVNIIWGFATKEERALFSSGKPLFDAKGRMGTTYAEFTAQEYPEVQALADRIVEREGIFSLFKKQVLCIPAVVFGAPYATIAGMVFGASVGTATIPFFAFFDTVTWSLLFCLSLSGLVFLWVKKQKILAVVCGGIVVCNVLVNLCISYTRMRVPLLPILLFLAGFGSLSFFDHRKQLFSWLHIRLKNCRDFFVAQYRTRSVPRHVVVIFCAAFFVRIAILLAVYFTKGDAAFLFGDSQGYLVLAKNMLAGHGASMAAEAPYLPDSIRTPLFPLLIAAASLFSKSIVLVLFVQVLLSMGTAFFVWRIADVWIGTARGKLIALALFAFEPLAVFFSLPLITEPLFTFLLTAGIYFFLRAMEDNHARNAIIAGAAWALAALTRPIAQFLPLIGVFFLFFSAKRRIGARNAALFFCTFLLVISPWVYRNIRAFNTAGLSSGGFQNVYSDYASYVLAVRDGVSPGDKKREMEQNYATRHNIPVSEIQQDLSQSSTLFREALTILVQNPIATIRTQAIITIAFFTHDSYIYFFQRWGLLPHYDPLFSPSFVIAREGIISGTQKILSVAGWSLIIPIIGRFFWIMLTIFAALGLIRAFRTPGQKRTIALFFLLMIGYFLLTSSTTGWGVNGRFRYPILPVLFVCVGFWFQDGWKFLRRK